MLRELWPKANMTTAEIAAYLGEKQWTINDAARRLGLGPKLRMSRRFIEDPTPEQIEVACAEIRRLHWDEDTYDQRAVSGAWRCPVVSIKRNS